ncbi:MAG: nicotinamide-nucleotide amidohydrolase family protein [Bacteroidales bacterium]|nr:nicotinamide-nucleotide amidohydrolase family protein [Bacteroidales bacterium]
MNVVKIINIGDELLIGQVVNTNASTMGRMLTEAGFEVAAVEVVGDTRADIAKAIDDGMEHYDVVLVTGGLGPTKDDITKQVLCDRFRSKLVESPVALENVRRIFAVRGFELTPVNRAQALVPECCEVLNNDLGTAPCMWFSLTPSPSPIGEGGRMQDCAPVTTPLSNRRGVGGETVLVSLPGVPFEMEWLMQNRVIPKLQEHLLTETIINKNILVQGIGESFLSDLIEPWELSLPKHIKLAYLPVAGMTKLRLTARYPRDSREPSISSVLPGLYELAGQYIVGEDCETLAELVHKTLISKGKTLATAESCTGGTIASQLTAQTGASAYFRGGVVAYSNEVKECALGVKHSTLEAHGAVSEETAREMAEEVRQRLGADLAIATTGIAGPDGGTPEKPVGTVWIAVADATHTEAQLLNFPGRRRQQNIDRTTNQAYSMLIKLLKP